jgi:hypothetical protein
MRHLLEIKIFEQGDKHIAQERFMFDAANGHYCFEGWNSTICFSNVTFRSIPLTGPDLNHLLVTPRTVWQPSFHLPKLQPLLGGI